jgi:hypothetical protein
VDSLFPFVDSQVIVGTPFGSKEFVKHFVSKAIEKSKIELEVIAQLENLQLQLLLVRYCITPIPDQHPNNILKFLNKEILLDDLNITFTEKKNINFLCPSILAVWASQILFIMLPPTILAPFNMVSLNWQKNMALIILYSFRFHPTRLYYLLGSCL